MKNFSTQTIYTHNYFYHARENIYGIRFSPEPSPPFRRIDFYIPPPIPKTVQKRPFASYIYIEKGRPFWLLFASFFRLWKNVRAKSEAFRRVPQSSSCRILV